MTASGQSVLRTLITCGVAVHSEATRAQAFVDHRLEEGPQLWFGVLADVELPPHHPVRLPVHQNDNAVRAVQESPAEE